MWHDRRRDGLKPIAHEGDIGLILIIHWCVKRHP
jgi:hypothetical protein